MLSGIQLIDKPVGFSSFQIVRTFKKYYKKVGHGGTLDPFASGLLIILIGQATKKFIEIQGQEKEYIGEIILGMVTDTYDISGTLTKTKTSMDITLRELNRMAREFTGEIEQMPPRFSAIKQGGKKLYELSRRGFSVQPKMRKVFVKSFCITEFDSPRLKFHTVVGKGVYVRSLTHDFGRRLACGATLMSLRRTKVGKYQITNAKKLGDILTPQILS